MDVRREYATVSVPELKFVKLISEFPTVLPAKAGIKGFLIPPLTWIPGRASFSLRLIRPPAESPAARNDAQNYSMDFGKIRLALAER